MFTKEQVKYIDALWLKAKERFEGREKAFVPVLDTCTIEEGICLKYVYSFMPLSDIADYDGKLILQFVKGALKAREAFSWAKSVPVEVFLNYVLGYRVNNENIEDYRMDFFQILYPRVKDLSMKEAALEVNYWCLEKAIYKSTDMRIASPLTVIRNAYGRCGEESTLLISALRSIGIPARQCYSPRWAHCDSNHAWVEVWIEGQWHYMGACEPEPILDTGWFDMAASRAMMTQVKAFGAVTLEEVMEKTPITSIINTLPHYAQTKPLTVQVVDKQGRGVVGIEVRFELLNFSQFFPIATGITDGKGEVTITTGLGDLMLCLIEGDKFYTEKVDVRMQERVIISKEKLQNYEIGYEAFDLVPPMVNELPEKAKSKEQNKVHEAKIEQANQIRKAYEETFYTEESAKRAASLYSPYDREVKDFLVKARGNHKMITNYLEQNQEVPLQYKVGILSTLRLKDYTDITSDLLVAHTKHAMQYKGTYEDAIFIPNILAPRIGGEMITDYKQGILDYFTLKEVARFKQDPECIMTYIQENIGECENLDYPTLLTTPLGTLAIKKGTLAAKHILFVAICRAIGVPAHIHRVDGTVEYYKEGEWVNRTLAKVEKQEGQSSTLILTKESEAEWRYGTHYGMARLEKGEYKPLQLYGEVFKDKEIRYTVRPGFYRLITSNRQVDGTLLVQKYCFEIKAKEKKVLLVAHREASLQEHLKDVQIVVKEFENLKAEFNIVIWLELGKEPTEHILNEILQQQERYNKLKEQVVFIIEGGQSLDNPLLQKVCAIIPGVHIWEVDRMDKVREKIGRRFSIEIDQYPLATVMTKEQKIKYASSGYNVGLADILLRIIEGLEG